MIVRPLKALNELSYERLAGTDGEKRAVAVITSYLESLKLDYETEKFDLNTFDSGKGHLKIDNKTVEVKPFGLNESCRVKGEMVFLENPEIMKQNLQAYKDKILLINGYSRGLIEAIKKQQPAAVIIIGTPFRKASSSSHRQNTFKEGYVHSATISHENALKIYKRTGQQAELIIDQKVYKSQASNIVVTIKGSNPDDKITYLVAHYDSVAKTEGASDNLGGTVSILSLAEYFSLKKPKRNLKIIFFSGEELGLLGSQKYVENHRKEIEEKAGLVINIDISGDSIANTKAIITGTKELLGYSQGSTREAGYCIEHSLDIYSSDQMPFTQYEVPGISFARVRGQASFYIHTEGDNSKYISANGLKVPIEAAKYLLNKILNSKVYPVNREIESSLRPKIEKYLWNLNYQEPKLYWTPGYKK